jgi:predicted secreted hydrolase
MLRLCAAFLPAAFLIFSCPTSHGSEGFLSAIPGRLWSFPRDHGKHTDYLTEWWYFTGNLESVGKRDWGFQLTFFRRSMSRDALPQSSRWATRDAYPAHFALTDVRENSFFHRDLISREGPGLAEAAVDRLGVRVRNWSAVQEGERIMLRAKADGHGLDLTLTPLKPLVLQGDAGYSRKGPDPNQASYYYSFTRLSAKGALTFKGERHEVEGLAWMDHEFGSSILTQEQAGWDWFSLQLDDGSDVMLFRLRKKDGRPETPFGGFIDKAGVITALAGDKIRLISTRTWKSSNSGAEYPIRWRIEIPERAINLKVEALTDAQEIETGRSTGVTYWEGAVNVSGDKAGAPLKGRGYMELTGYAHSMGGRL